MKIKNYGDLRDRQKYNKKHLKGLSPFEKRDAGNPEINAKFFNNSTIMGQSSNTSDNSSGENTSIGNISSGGEGMGESIEINEANEKFRYTYEGPVWYDGDKIYNKYKASTYAVSEKQAKANIRYRLADKNRYEINRYDIDDSLIFEDPTEEEIEKEMQKALAEIYRKEKEAKEYYDRYHNRCAKCGRDLTVVGECPVCDLGWSSDKY